MEKKVVSFLLIFWIMSTSSPLASDEYTIGVGDYEYYPYHTYVNGEYTGFEREVLDLFAQKYNLGFKHMPFPWKRLIRAYADGKLDFIFPDNPHWDTDKKEGKKVHYSKPIVQYADGVMVLSENKGKGIRFLKRLGTIRGFTPWDYYDQINSGQIQLEENNKFIPLLKQVLSKRIDGAYIDIAVARYNLHEKMKKSGALVFDPDLPHTRDFYHLSSIRHPDIVKKFDNFLDIEKDAINQLKKKYKVGTLFNK